MTDTRPDDRIPEAEIVADSQPPSDTVLDPTPDRPPVTPAPGRAQVGRTVFLGLVLGGIVAAGLGFAAARFVPQGWPLLGQTAGVDGTVALEQRLSALEADFQAAATRAPLAPAPDPRLDGIAAELADLQAALAARPVPVVVPDPAATERVEAIDRRLAAIEQSPQAPGGGVAPAAFAALQAEVRSLREGVATGASAAAQPIIAEVQAAADAAEARLAEAEAGAQALTKTTTAMTQAAARAAAFIRLRSAIDAGLPFDAALSDLAAAGVAVPDSLTGTASAGVPTIADLRDSFPAIARAALEASRQADMGDTFGERLGSFLQDQTGARSLEPREGTDPDAVLSRADAALRGGDLPGAQRELTGLPADGQAAVADWVARAQARIATLEAVTTLAAQTGD